MNAKTTTPKCEANRDIIRIHKTNKRINGNGTAMTYTDRNGCAMKALTFQ